MTATPAQVANDMRAQGAYWDRRDDHVSQLCFDAARLITDMMSGNTGAAAYHDVRRRLVLHGQKVSPQPASQISRSISRCLNTLQELRTHSGDTGA